MVMILLKVCCVVVQEACPDAAWSLTFFYGGAVQSFTLKVAHSTLLVVCLFIVAQMPAYLSLQDDERLLRHDMCYMFIISIKMMYTCFFWGVARGFLSFSLSISFVMAVNSLCPSHARRAPCSAHKKCNLRLCT